MCLCCKKHGKTQPSASKDYLINESDVTDSDNCECKCRLKFCVFWTLLIILLLALTLVLLLFLVIIPIEAQKSVNNSVMQTLYISLSNATNESVLMNVTMQIENTGSYDATISSINAKTYDEEDNYIGTLLLPKIKVKANKGATFQLIEPLYVNNVTTFKKMTSRLLQGQDVSIKLKAKPSIKVSIAGVNIKCKVSLDHTMILEGTKIQNLVASNFTILHTTNTSLVGAALMSFSSDSTMLMEFSDIKMNLYNSNGVYFGYSFVSAFSIKAGYNVFFDVPTILEKTENNIEVLQEFLGNFMMGKNQYLFIEGPVSYKNKSTIIDGSLNSTVLAMGNTAGATAVSGILTSESQIGWTINDTLYTGAYSMVYNSLNVPLRLLNISVDLDLWDSIEWGYDISVILKYGLQGNCSTTNKFARLHSGHGMYQNNYKKDYVDINANDYASFFVWGTPQPSQYGYPDNFTSCLTYDYPCCFITEPLASICKINPNLKSDIDSELENSFLKTHLYSNMTVRIGEAFIVDIKYDQDFFPVYFGSEVYQGYTADLGLSCTDIDFPTISN